MQSFGSAAPRLQGLRSNANVALSKALRTGCWRIERRRHRRQPRMLNRQLTPLEVRASGSRSSGYRLTRISFILALPVSAQVVLTLQVMGEGELEGDEPTCI